MYEAIMARIRAARGEQVDIPESWGMLPGLMYVRDIGQEGEEN